MLNFFVKFLIFILVTLKKIKTIKRTFFYFLEVFHSKISAFVSYIKLIFFAFFGRFNFRYFFNLYFNLGGFWNFNFRYLSREDIITLGYLFCLYIIIFQWFYIFVQFLLWFNLPGFLWSLKIFIKLHRPRPQQKVEYTKQDKIFNKKLEKEELELDKVFEDRIKELEKELIELKKINRELKVKKSGGKK